MGPEVLPAWGFGVVAVDPVDPVDPREVPATDLEESFAPPHEDRSSTNATDASTRAGLRRVSLTDPRVGAFRAGCAGSSFSKSSKHRPEGRRSPFRLRLDF